MHRQPPTAPKIPPMAVETTTWTFVHHGRSVSIAGVRSAKTADQRGSPKPVLLFEHSWNIPPLPDYRELLDALDQRFHVVGLTKNGLNNLRGMEPRTIAGHAELTISFCRWLLMSKTASSLSILGHSLGFATAYAAMSEVSGNVRSLIGVAPLLPGNHSIKAFVYRFLAMSVGMGALRTTGLAGQHYFWTSGPRFIGRVLRNPLASLSLVADMARVRFDDVVQVPTLIIAPYSDELVPRDVDRDSGIHEIFPQLEWHLMEDPSHRHSLPLFHGRRVAAIVAEHFRRVMRTTT